jgi:hypothetical protein
MILLMLAGNTPIRMILAIMETMHPLGVTMLGEKALKKINP